MRPPGPDTREVSPPCGRKSFGLACPRPWASPDPPLPPDRARPRRPALVRPHPMIKLVLASLCLLCFPVVPCLCSPVDGARWPPNGRRAASHPPLPLHRSPLEMTSDNESRDAWPGSPPTARLGVSCRLGFWPAQRQSLLSRASSQPSGTLGIENSPGSLGEALAGLAADTSICARAARGSRGALGALGDRRA